MKHVHVIHAGNRWAVVAGGGHGREIFHTQDEAIVSGMEKAQRRQVKLFVHGRDGQIRESNSYGQDRGGIKRGASTSMMDRSKGDGRC
ncbi:DUF2188 domain-containing protein [Cupriavidus necator]|uniref:DUF2188 domain-containing protein n=1 Tax=Cupriavidus necator TaxID=106590 RepID=UPI0009FDBDC1|nr:DUF2188 domain-containing protein [Cupriavidus necator]